MIIFVMISFLITELDKMVMLSVKGLVLCNKWNYFISVHAESRLAQPNQVTVQPEATQVKCSVNCILDFKLILGLIDVIIRFNS